MPDRSIARTVLATTTLLLAATVYASPQLVQQYNCQACHAVDRKVVGPSFKDIAARYKGQNVQARLEEKVRKGGSGSFGTIPMPPSPQVPAADLSALIKWTLAQ